MAWIELTGKRSAKEKHFYDADTNKYQAILTVHDQHYHDGNNWQEVNTSFVADSGGFDRRCDQTRHTIRVSNGGMRRWYPRRNVLTEYVDITNIQYFTNQWRNLNLPTPVWTNNKSEWDMTNLYASLTNTWRSIKANFILKNSNAYTRLRFAVTFVGLNFNQETGELTSTTDGLVWGYIRKPTAKDNNGADVLVTQVYDGAYIEWIINTAGATFPINVDPTFTDGVGGDVNTACDTWLDSGGVDNNKDGDAGILYRVGVHAGLLKFTLTTLVGKTITTATLHLFKNSGGDTNGLAYRILPANNSWTETGATWNHQTGTTDWAGSVGCQTSGTDFSSTLMGTWAQHNADAQGAEYSFLLNSTEFGLMISNNYGLFLSSDNGDIMGNAVSSDFFEGEIWYPKLVVVYTEEAPPTVVTSTATVTVAVEITVTVEVTAWC